MMSFVPLGIPPPSLPNALNHDSTKHGLMTFKYSSASKSIINTTKTFMIQNMFFWRNN